jgi:hypothetical protein
MQSAEIGELAKALAAAQKQMGVAVKDTSNPFFKSKYADLQSVWEACRGPLADNGLAVAQTTGPSYVEGSITVYTHLMHSSGQYLVSALSMKPVKADPQGVGSCITYARRYALAAMVGVYQADDDGNDASGKTDEPKKFISEKPTPKTASGSEPWKR